jgi:hypothetical protein
MVLKDRPAVAVEIGIYANTLSILKIPAGYIFYFVSYFEIFRKDVRVIKGGIEDITVVFSDSMDSVILIVCIINGITMLIP